MFAESGTFVLGRRTYDITHGWNGRHPVNGVPVFVLTHEPPPASEVPQGPSNLTYVTDGIESAIDKAKAAAGDKHVKLGGASLAKQALQAGLVRTDQLDRVAHRAHLIELNLRPSQWL
jgi:dihydrofolate reductase